MLWIPLVTRDKNTLPKLLQRLNLTGLNLLMMKLYHLTLTPKKKQLDVKMLNKNRLLFLNNS